MSPFPSSVSKPICSLYSACFSPDSQQILVKTYTSIVIKSVCIFNRSPSRPNIEAIFIQLRHPGSGSTLSTYLHAAVFRSGSHERLPPTL
eukprot:6203420-Pleurochrysis_carterae.AAC.1